MQFVIGMWYPMCGITLLKLNINCGENLTYAIPELPDPPGLMLLMKGKNR